MSTPLYKEGEIVRLKPWDNFDKHISIPHMYWDDLMNKDLEVFNIQTDSGYDTILNGKQATCIYYSFVNHSFSWCEEFLTPTYTNFLADEDFEI